MTKKSILAAAIVVALAGCSDSDSASNGGNDGDTGSGSSQSRFIDAAVEGLYFKASNGNSGLTDALGNFRAGSDSTVTFYIGDESGLKIGAASNKNIVGPFEVAGTYERALNLAILLQSVDENSDPDSITLPSTLTDNIDSTVLSGLNNVLLDDRDTVVDFLKGTMGLGDSEIVSEEAASQHLTNSFDGLKIGNDAPSFLVRGESKIFKEVSVSQYQLHNEYDQDSNTSGKQYYVHVDKTVNTPTYEAVKDASKWYFRLDADDVVYLAGNNDSSFGSTYAAEYLTCLNDDASNNYEINEDNSIRTCEGNTATIDQDFDLDEMYLYKFSNPAKAESENESYGYDSAEMAVFFPAVLASKETELNKLIETNVYSDGDGAYEDMQYNIYSSSYDPVTKVLTTLDKKFNLGDGADKDKNSPSSSSHGGVSESISFLYEVNSETSERYVNFDGVWKNTETCDNGVVATATFDFDAIGVVISGKECNNGAPGDFGGEYSYEDLAGIDYWWFNQDGRKSKATLSELNTTVRFCDEDNFTPGDTCNFNDDYFVKWSYLPAGKNWDEGVLTRRKLTANGNVAGVSVMQKVF